MTTRTSNSTEPSLQEAWEAQAERWIRWARTPGHDSYWQFHRDAFLPLVPQGERTLDAGCGEGRLSRDLTARGHNVTGIDASPTLLAAAREAHPEGNYAVARISSMPFSDASFDVIVAFMSLQDVDDLDASIAECARVLRPQGTLVFSIVHPLNSAGTFTEESADSPFVLRGSYLTSFRYSDRIERDGLSMEFHSVHHSLETYSRALEAARLTIDALREPPASTPHPPSERTKRWHRIPLFLHVRAKKS